MNEVNFRTNSGKDYFAGVLSPTGEDTTHQPPVTPSLPPETPGSPEPTKESSFMGRLKSFGTKKLQSKPEKDEATAPSTSNGSEKEEAEKAEEEAANATPKETAPYMFSDVLTSIRKTYEKALFPQETNNEKDDISETSISRIPVLAEDGKLKSALTPTPIEEAPPIQPMQDTIIIIAEQKVSVDGSMDLYRGTVASLGCDADVLEAVAPGWLAELLLLVISGVCTANLDRTDFQRKISSRLVSRSNLTLHRNCRRWLLGIPITLLYLTIRNSRLNANRMLRARKVVSYVAERIESALIPSDTKDQPDTWLDILCQDKVRLSFTELTQIVPPKWTLQTIRTQMWRQGGDIIFTYRLKWEGDRQ